MSKKIRIPLKIVVFTIIFYLLCICISAIFRDDYASYGRILMHELYEQDNIDIMYCGASHVSHGITAKIADKENGKNNFSSGTAAQTINGTYAILRQAVKLYKIEKVFLELDFAVATQPSVKNRKGFKADYLVSRYIKDPVIRFEYLTSISTPKYYINHFLPIGKDKYMTLNPKDLAYRFKSIVSGDYFNYVYEDEDAEYDGKGCLLDVRPIKNGTFENDKDEGPIRVWDISDDWKNTVDKIIALCKEHNIELIFYSQPCTDFYLHEKGNYDEYYQFCKDFTSSRGFDYYDFNLAKEKYQLLEDEDFHDDNHFSKQGVYKWTQIFCDYFFTHKIPKDDMFHSSYAEKIALQEDKIYGLVMKMSDDKKSLDITPIKNHVEDSRITYDVFVKVDGKESQVCTKTSDKHIVLPAKQTGTVRVVSFIDGVEQTNCKTHFTTF